MKLPLAFLFFFISVISTAEDSGSLNALQKQISQSAESSSGGAAELMALDLLAGKFKIGSGDTPPEWFTEYYPIAAEMDPDQTHFPRLKFQYSVPSSVGIFAPTWEAHRSKSNASDTTCSVTLNPPTPLFSAPNDNPLCRLDAKEFLIDRSGLSSLEKAPTNDKYQEGYISIPKLDGLTEAEQQAVMTQTNFSLPKSTSSVSPIKVKFRKLIAHAEHPQALGKIEVQAGSTLAEIPVDLPPAPECKLVPSPGYMGPFSPGATANFELHADSIVLTGRVSADGFNNSEALPSGRQLVRNIGAMTNLGTFSFTVPQNPWPGTETRPGFVKWTISGEIVGLTNQQQPVDCEVLDVEVRKALPPACILAANPMSLAQGQTTKLTLTCQNLVTSATIDGVAVTLNASGVATRDYVKKTSSGAEEVVAIATGPGGSTTTDVDLGAACPFSNPNYLFSYGGRQFSRAVTYYVGGYKKVCLRGKGCVDQPYHMVTHQVAGHIKYGGGHGGINMYCDSNAYCMNNNFHNFGKANHHVIQVGPANSPSCTVQKYQVRGNGCFSKNTQILMANGRLKPVAEVQENDFVFNPHYQAAVRVKKVVKGPEHKPLYEVVIDNSRLEVTEDHPFFTQRGWVQAMALKKGDRLLGKGQGKKVSTVTKMNFMGPEDVWNFELDSEDPMAHVVVANGIPTGDLVTQVGIKSKKQMNP